MLTHQVQKTQNRKNMIFNENISRDSLSDLLDKSPNSVYDLILVRPDFSDCPLKEEMYSRWLVDISKKMMRLLKSTGSLVVVLKENVSGGKRNPYSIEYLKSMSDNDYWTETFIWHKSNPHPTGNPKRLKDAFEYCYQFNRSKDYKFFPEQCLIRAKDEWNFGNESSTVARPSNVISAPYTPKGVPSSLAEFFINLMTEKDDFVFIPFVCGESEIISCLKTNRRYFGVYSNSKDCNLIEEKLSAWRGSNIPVSNSIFGI